METNCIQWPVLQLKTMAATERFRKAKHREQIFCKKAKGTEYLCGLEGFYGMTINPHYQSLNLKMVTRPKINLHCQGLSTVQILPFLSVNPTKKDLGYQYFNFAFT